MNSKSSSKFLFSLMKGNQNQTNSKDFIEVIGEVIELMPAGSFRIQLKNGHEILAHLSGKMRIHRVRISQGDKVKIQMSPYDLTKGRITYRM